MDERQQKLRDRMDAQALDALLVTNLTNVRYLTGFAGSNGYVFLTRDASWFYTDGRYATQASHMVEG
ncbi:MAG TPA: aminopeptidase P family N-terminal domain-containing protein, partial [Actinomycetota bacterium]|nr:aminopeptidase P family N-terminal domain-containing protein [Actinomycetota bacterium]